MLIEVLGLVVILCRLSDLEEGLLVISDGCWRGGGGREYRIGSLGDGPE
jgi:hypothetical protein